MRSAELIVEAEGFAAAVDAPAWFLNQVP